MKMAKEIPGAFFQKRISKAIPRKSEVNNKCLLIFVYSSITNIPQFYLEYLSEAIRSYQVLINRSILSRNNRLT